MPREFSLSELSELEEGFPQRSSKAFAAAARRAREAGIPVLEARDGELVQIVGAEVRVIGEIARPVAVTKREFILR